MRNLLVTVAVLVFANIGTAAELPSSALPPHQVAIVGANVQGCISFTDKGSYWIITNHCSRVVYVRWHHEGHCNTGCGTTVSAGVEQPIIGPRGWYTWTVRYPNGQKPL
jgi:hypothetical protein